MRILLLIASLFLVGCTQRTPDSLVKLRQSSILKTQRDEFTKSGVKYLVLTSYVGEIDSNLTSKSHDEFIVAVYRDVFSEKASSVSNVLLNKKMEDIFVEYLEKGDKRRKLSPLNNQWVDYFLVQAPTAKEKNLTLSYEIDHSFVVVSKFVKDF